MFNTKINSDGTTGEKMKGQTAKHQMLLVHQEDWAFLDRGEILLNVQKCYHYPQEFHNDDEMILL